MRGVLVCLVVVLGPWSRAAEEDVGEHKIDRRALVARHALKFDRYAPQSPASLGNGRFAFTFDVTGLQTFLSDSPGHIPLCTMADWSWHSFPTDGNPFEYEQTLRQYTVDGRQVSYATDMQSDAAKHFRANPHRFSLGRIALFLTDSEGNRADVEQLESVAQEVDLWNGEAVSRFRFQGMDVEVTTTVHPTLDAVAVSLRSPLVGQGRLGVELSFAYPAGEWGPQVDDWQKPLRHQTTLETGGPVQTLHRVADTTQYDVHIDSTATLAAADAPHTYLLRSNSGERLDAVILFSQVADSAELVPAFQETRRLAHGHWNQFWNNGGMIDLSQSSDPRWRELERRIVLSQFLTAVNCAGEMPPQETGLVCNSWFGKSHLEMHWWHATHFALWGRASLLERSLDWYRNILPAARAIAARQDYAGVRWPKMTGPHGMSSPSEVGELLIWQQPHPIYFAELIYRDQPTPEILARYASIVEQTADFMADYAILDTEQDRYVLGPVLIPAQECYNGRQPPGVLNPTFELAYWRWALRTANQWRHRLGQDENTSWREVEQKIASPHIESGIYTAIENFPYTNRRDHPSMLGALGVLPDVGLIDRPTMNRTLKSVLAEWDWPDTWGWDYPMMAMTAARLGETATAVDCLLLDTPKNHYLANGHCRQEDRLPIYLPANGGLLTAVGMMAAGWDGSAASAHSPGFPEAQWKVLYEDIRPMP